MACQTIASPLVTKNQDFITRQEEPLHDPHISFRYGYDALQDVLFSNLDRSHHQSPQETKPRRSETTINTVKNRSIRQEIIATTTIGEKECKRSCQTQIIENSLT